MIRFSFFILATLFAIHGANAGQVYLVSEDEGQFLLTDDRPFNRSGIVDNFAFGLCIEDQCEKQFNMADAFKKNMAMSNGFLNIPKEQESYYTFPSYSILSHSEITERNEKSLNINVSIEAQMEGSLMPMGSKSFLVEALPLKIDFSNTEESRSNRISYRDIESKYSTYYRKVFQMMGAIENNGLGGMAQSHGTGFFIDKRGYALTNLHVLNENPQCVLKRSCSIDIKQKSNQVETFNVSLRVLTCSKRNDFCLIKINIPKGLIIENFELDLNTISKNLMTVGFPGDKERAFETVDGQEVQEVDITYSFGSPVGFSGSAITSSLYIFGGASGSPIIDLNSGEVVGLNSNGAETFAMGQDGFPGIFRSLAIIDKEFEILDYLSGEKQRKIEGLIRQLKETSSKNEAEMILAKMDKHKSFYGRSKLEVLSYNHKNGKIRKLINKNLNKSLLDNH